MKELTMLIFCLLAFIAVVQESHNGTKRLEASAASIAQQINYGGQYR
jgi:hypothetical protein